MSPENEPLWRVMAGAWSARVIVGRPDADRLATAAELRALRDWLVPEEARVFRPDCTLDEHEEARLFYRHGERQRLRAMLTAEAERAEKGE